MLARRKSIGYAVALALGVAAAGAQGAAVVFDTQTNGLIQFDALDWNQSSFLAQNGNTAIQNYLSNRDFGTNLDTSFTVLTHAKLGNFQLNNQNVQNTGLGTNYEVTMVAKFTEKVLAVTPVTVDVDGPGGNPPVLLTTIVSFQLQPTLTDVLFYYDTAKNSDQLTGSGFNDGTLIFRGQALLASNGSFQIDPDARAQALDQFNSDDYTGQLTLDGFGSQNTVAIGDIETADAFFKNKLIEFEVKYENISQKTPFTTVDPSDCFTQSYQYTTVGNSNPGYACDTSHTNDTVNAPFGMFTNQSAADAFGYVPVTGVVNGLLPIVNPQLGGKDFIAQTDFNSSIVAENVPEPGSLALVGLGLGLLGLGAKRRRLTMV